MKVCCLVNPNSGKKKGPQIFKSIKPILEEKKIDYNLIETKRPGHAINIVNELNIEEYNCLVMIGGDGTFHEIVTGLMNRKDQKKIPIGIVPAGSGNSFLYDQNIKEPLMALNQILDFKKKNIDVMEIKTPHEILYSINLVGWGLVTDLGISAE